MLNVDELPFLTADVPGLGGKIKTCREDFIVGEVPLYEPSGEGTHVYFRIEKAGLPTMRAVEEIARALHVRARDIGYAGLKDSEAVTTQTLSLEHIDPARIEALELPRIRVLEVNRHTNKLKLGHLKGNRFVIRLREVDPARADDVRTMLETLSRRGVPNYFGPQRFGMRGDTWQVGLAMLRNDPAEAVAVMLGKPGPQDYGNVLDARQLFERGEYEAAADAWPHPFNNERRLCRAIARAEGDADRAFRTVDKKLKRFFVSAYQSHLFNQVLARRLGELDQLWPGDLAWRHPQGAIFTVEDVEREQPRCEVFEISPTGPMFGHKMKAPEGRQAELEQAVLAEAGFSPDDWRNGPERNLRGTRRPLRFQPQDVAVEGGTDERGPYLEIQFFLESGCYATTVLREICKSSMPDAP